MALPDLDREFLEEKNHHYEVVDADGFTNLVITDYRLPNCYTPNTVLLLIRLPEGYPLTPPDMFFTIPDNVVLAANGQTPDRCTGKLNSMDKTWQQWSRHFPAEEWRPGVDYIRTYLAMIRSDLEQCI